MKKLLLALPAAACWQPRRHSAQQIDLGGIGQADGTTIGYIIQMFGLLTVLSVAPGLLIMVTSFTRFVIAFSILRAGIGPADDAGQPDPDQPVAVHDLLRHGADLRPGLEQRRQAADGQRRSARPRRSSASPTRSATSWCSNVREKDFDLFADLARERGQTDLANETVDLRVLVPAFMISEIRRGFEIGFLIVLPFLVIDLIVATITMAMGMMMLPPTVVSLPFKITVLRPDRRLEPAGRQPGAILQLSGSPIAGHSGINLHLH